MRGSAAAALATAGNLSCEVLPQDIATRALASPSDPWGGVSAAATSSDVRLRGIMVPGHTLFHPCVSIHRGWFLAAGLHTEPHTCRCG